MSSAAETFKMLDKNGDGKITLDELAEGFKSIGRADSLDQVQATFSKYDKDGDGHITMDEFEALHAEVLA